LTIKNSKNYQRKKLEYSLVSNILELLLIVIFLVSGLSLNFRIFLEGIAGKSFPLLFLLYFITIGLVHEVLFFPLSFFRGYKLEHSYSLSNQDLSSWLKDHIKMTIIGWILGIFTLGLIYTALHYSPESWWWQAALILWLLYIVMVKFAPLVLFPLFFKFTPLENEEIKEKIKKLAESVNIGILGIFEFNMSRKTKAANAAVTGLGSTRRIILSDTLIKNHTPDEITSVVAHEFGHHRHKHIISIIIMNCAMLFLFFYISKIILDTGTAHFGFTSPGDVAAFPLLAIVFSIGGLLFLPAMNTIMRAFERQADRFAIESTKNPSAFISMMQKLSDENLADPSPNSLIEILFHSHPSTGKRINFAKKYLDQFTVEEEKTELKK
jgi:STE24 endopeptidase